MDISTGLGLAFGGFVLVTLIMMGGDLKMFLGVPPQYRLFLSTRLTAVPNLAATPWLLSCTAPLGQDVIQNFHERFGAVIGERAQAGT